MKTSGLVLAILLACAVPSHGGILDSAPDLVPASPANDQQLSQSEFGDLGSILPEFPPESWLTVAGESSVLGQEETPVDLGSSGDLASPGGILALRSAGFSIPDIIGYELANPWLSAAGLIASAVLVLVVALYRRSIDSPPAL
jgi:hypothetical protein